MTKCLVAVLFAAGLILGTRSLHAGEDEWTDAVGRPFIGELRGTLGGLALVAEGKRARLLPLAEMDEATLDRVVASLAALPGRQDWKTSAAAVPRALQNRLQRWDGSKLADYIPNADLEPEIYLIYFSAHWCGPCRRFTPKLIESYRQMKQQHGDLLELIFISNDRSADEQKRYIKEAEMPWPVLKYNHLGRARVVEQWAGDGIPCLVAVTKHGEVMFHSYRNGEYAGPQEPLDLVRRLLEQADPEAPATKFARHRYAVREHVRAVSPQSTAPKPFLLRLNGESYRRSGVPEFTAQVAVDAGGRARLLNTTPVLDAILADQLRQEVAQWLFLPAVEDGHAKPVVVSLPLKL